MNRLTLLPLAMLAFAYSAIAQDTSADEAFHSVFDRFVGEEWLFHIEMYDADGNVSFSGVDVRRFQFGVGGTFLIENVYRTEDDAHIGIQLIGLNRQNGTIHLSTFFPWQATALAEVSGRFTGTDGIEGESSATLPDGTQLAGRFACQWLDGRWTCESFIKLPDGSERRGDRNFYCRRSDPDCVLPETG